jgi:chloramphenicol O-acetyltransferase type A
MPSPIHESLKSAIPYGKLEKMTNRNLTEGTMAREINPKDTTRAAAYELWMNAPNPMVTLFKTLDVTNLIRISKKKHLKFNMLLDYCIGKAAVGVKEFYLLPVGEKLMQYDTIAVNTIVENKDGGVSSCDILYTDDLETFHLDYLNYTAQTAKTSQDRDLSADSMVIGTSAIIATEIDGAVGMNSGIYNNPFIIWGKYRKKFFRYTLPISFQFHHTQMDGAHAGRFLENLQNEINRLK